jgi:hypothetical protein
MTLLAKCIVALVLPLVVASFVTAPVSVDALVSKERTKLREQPEEWKGFNPLASTGVAKAFISMRQTQMQELTTHLMENVNDDEKIQELLEKARSLLLEPLDNDNAALDPESIYSPGMTRAQRYLKYRLTMEARISSASRADLKKMLQAMKDFVLSQQ